MTTSYHYSASDDLLAVCQAGTFDQYYNCTNDQGRQFTYDWLSRLTSATNPETTVGTSQTPGTISYSQYDGNGNLLSKTNSQGITTTMSYDALNRLLTKSYSNGTPPVTYCYDGKVAASGGGSLHSRVARNPEPLLHLTQEYSSASTSSYTAFDAMGHVTASSQQTPSATGTLYPLGTAANPGYVYNLAGQLTSETYPSGRKITFDYDPEGRTAQVNNPANSLTYASLSLFNPSGNQYAYAPNGGIQTMTLGNTVAENWIWDPIRLLPTQTQIGSLLTLSYF